METKTNAIVSVKSLMSNVNVKGRFEELLGKNSAKFISTVIQVSNSSALMGAVPQTVMNAAVIAATLDLPVNPNLGFAYIVPYNNRGVKEAQFQMGWKGFYQLAMNSGIYKKITTNEVYEGELVVKNRFKEEYEFGERKSNKIVGYLAYYETLAGAEKYLYMTKEDVEAHAKRFSQAYRNNVKSSPWNDNFDAMAKKTVLKLLLSKYGKLSIEMQMAQIYDQAVIGRHEDLTQVEDIDTVEADYVDNTEAAPVQAPAETLQQKMAKAGELFGNEKSEEK